jgi:hypothetical protein
VLAWHKLGADTHLQGLALLWACSSHTCSVATEEGSAGFAGSADSINLLLSECNPMHTGSV